MSKKEDNEIKVILVGESGTGKTSLINTSIGLPFKENMMTSATNSFAPKEMQIGNKKYILNLWDTIGQEKYRTLTKIFIKDSKIVIFVFDITKKKTFLELDYWIKTINDILKDEAVLGIAGNKQDLYMNEEVKEETIEKYAKEKGILFQYTSAKNTETFKSLLEELLKKYIIKTGGVIDSGNGGFKIGENGQKEPVKRKFC